MSKITITKERVDGQTVYAWAVGDKGGHCATEADARNDARIASEGQLTPALIAAAPELLSALRDVLEIVEAEYNEDPEPEALPSWKRAIEAANAAIAQAEGAI